MALWAASFAARRGLVGRRSATSVVPRSSPPAHKMGADPARGHQDRVRNGPPEALRAVRLEEEDGEAKQAETAVTFPLNDAFGGIGTRTGIKRPRATVSKSSFSFSFLDTSG